MKNIINITEVLNIEPYDLLLKVNITKAPVDVFSLAKSLPIQVDTTIDSDDRASLSGEIFYDTKTDKIVIWINPLDSKNRQRFTMAHEIAHLVKDIVPNLGNVNKIKAFHDKPINLKRDGRQDPKEFRANEFAAQLLMPVDFVIEETKKAISDYKKQKGTNAKIPLDELVSTLSKIFEVSQQAMQIRLTRLGII